MFISFPPEISNGKENLLRKINFGVHFAELVRILHYGICFPLDMSNLSSSQGWDWGMTNDVVRTVLILFFSSSLLTVTNPVLIGYMIWSCVFSYPIFRTAILEMINQRIDFRRKKTHRYKMKIALTI